MVAGYHFYCFFLIFEKLMELNVVELKFLNRSYSRVVMVTLLSAEFLKSCQTAKEINSQHKQCPDLRSKCQERHILHPPTLSNNAFKVFLNPFCNIFFLNSLIYFAYIKFSHGDTSYA